MELAKYLSSYVYEFLKIGEVFFVEARRNFETKKCGKRHGNVELGQLLLIVDDLFA